MYWDQQTRNVRDWVIAFCCALFLVALWMIWTIVYDRPMAEEMRREQERPQAVGR